MLLGVLNSLKQNELNYQGKQIHLIHLNIVITYIPAPEVFQQDLVLEASE